MGKRMEKPSSNGLLSIFFENNSKLRDIFFPTKNLSIKLKRGSNTVSHDCNLQQVSFWQ